MKAPGRLAAPRLAVRRLAWRALLLVACAAAVPSLAIAASAAPAASPLASFNGVEIWLDADVVAADAPRGGTLEAGFTLWFPRQQEFFGLGGFGARMLPGTGTAEPSVATIEEDFPGHVIATFVVPEGGPGSIEVGITGQACLQDGTCSDVLTPIAIAGTGPPPDADPTLLVTGAIHPVVDIVAGRATPLTVDVVPRGRWAPSALGLPDHLVVTAARRGERPVASAEIRTSGAQGAEYAGLLTVPEAGEFTLTVAIPGADGFGRPIAGASLAVTVLAGAGGEVTAPSGGSQSPTAPADGGQPVNVPLIVGVGLVLVVGAVVLRRVVADL